jgi:phosphohistidine phosphatase
MKTVYIMRHAMSGPAGPGTDDVERTLTNRGREVASQVGAYMDDNNMSPDAALVSAAARTVETWKQVSSAAGWKMAPRLDQRFYLAPERIWLGALVDLKPEISSVLIIGHHPGVDGLAVMLAGQGAPTAVAEMRAGFTTGALAELELDCNWENIEAGSGTLTRFVTPRHLQD